MKTKIVIIIATVVNIVFFIGCKKTHVDNNTPLTSTGMSARIMEYEFNATNIQLRVISDTTLMLSAKQFQVGEILFQIRAFNGIGTYILTPTTLSNKYIEERQSYGKNAIHYIQHGEVTITSTSPILVGDFFFTCSDSLHIVNGKFAVDYN